MLHSSTGQSQSSNGAPAEASQLAPPSAPGKAVSNDSNILEQKPSVSTQSSINGSKCFEKKSDGSPHKIYGKEDLVVLHSNSGPDCKVSRKDRSGTHSEYAARKFRGSASSGSKDGAGMYRTIPATGDSGGAKGYGVESGTGSSHGVRIASKQTPVHLALPCCCEVAVVIYVKAVKKIVCGKCKRTMKV
jgi:hypothetical protein